MEERNLVIVGGGPLATYALGQLIVVLQDLPSTVRLQVSVFDRAGSFGAGDVHSDRQARTSYLNREAGLIAFAADESSTMATRLLPTRLRPTFHEWCMEQLAHTGDPSFNIQPAEMPLRFIHGMALRDMFGRYVNELRRLPRVSVSLKEAEVVDVLRSGNPGSPFLVQARNPRPFDVAADHILFVTGHSSNRPSIHDASQSGIRHIENAYPLNERITMSTAPAGAVIGVNGLGLTAIDVFLHLTEGRGGHFRTETGGELTYVRGGNEPAVIVAASPSGIPVSGKARNQKILDPGRLQHRAVFFSKDAICRLRACAGRGRLDDGGRLDFSRHLLPLIALEMAYVYYRTLLGPRFAQRLKEAVDGRYEAFLSGGGPWSSSGADYLLEPAQDAFMRVTDVMCTLSRPVPPEISEMTDVFRRVLYGSVNICPPVGTPSPWGHSIDIRDHRFDWRQMLEPITADPGSAGEVWHKRVMAYLHTDVKFCIQGNVDNPVKAACDSVWRDLRPEITFAVDRGGLGADSQREFISRYWRYYNRLGNGPGITPLRKLIALADAGLIDFSVGPKPEVIHNGDGTFTFLGTVTGASRKVDAIIDAWVHPFSPADDIAPLYRNLIRSGLVRQWRNPGGHPGETDLLVGALDLDEAHHPLSASGHAERRLTFLGAPVEGLKYFQLSVGRPNSDNYVLNNAVQWAEEIMSMLSASGG
jgi:hypothetical protein